MTKWPAMRLVWLNSRLLSPVSHWLSPAPFPRRPSLAERPQRTSRWTWGLRLFQLPALSDSSGPISLPTRGSRHVHPQGAHTTLLELLTREGEECLTEMPDLRRSELRGHVVLILQCPGSLQAGQEGDEGSSFFLPIFFSLPHECFPSLKDTTIFSMWVLRRKTIV